MQTFRRTSASSSSQFASTVPRTPGVFVTPQKRSFGSVTMATADTEVPSPTPEPVWHDAVDSPAYEPSYNPGVMDVEAFEKELEQLAALNPRKSTSQLPRKKTRQSNPLEPVPLGKARASDAIKHLHEACQERVMQLPEYKFSEPEPQSFSVKMTVAGRTFEEPGPFPNKKDAKQAVSEQALEYVKSLPAPSKTKSIMSQGASTIKQKENEPTENYVGLLLEYTNATKTPAPICEEFQYGTGFSCELQLSQRPEEPFGSRTLAFSSKKGAKVNAHREAVEWLRQRGDMPPAGAPPLKAKKAASPGSESPESIGESGYMQQVLAICSVLKLTPPRFDLQPVPGTPAFYSGGAWFDNSPDIPSPLGEVRNIHGRKAAKEQCARLVLEYLEQLKAKREALLQRILEQRKNAQNAMKA